MSLLSFNSLVCWQITLALLHVSWIGLVIGMIVALANAVLRNSTANRRYWLNFASLLLFAASLPITFAIVRGVTAEVPTTLNVAETPVAEVANLTLPIVEEPTLVMPPTDAVDFSPNSPQSLPSAPEVPAVVSLPTVTQPPPSAWERVTSIGHAAAPFVAILYAIGVALMFVKLAYGVRVSRKLRSASQPVTDANILARLAEQAKKLSLRATPVIAFCEHTAVPIVVGLLRPMILIPAAMVNGLTIEQLESVLTHELAHLRRRDHLMIVVQRVLEAILFFHPVTWYLSHRLHDDRETSCDDLVLSIGGDRLQYAQSLLRVAELRLASQAHQKHIALAADGQRPSKLRQRIARLLGDSESDSVRVSSVWLVVTVLAFLIVGIASLSSTNRPVFAAVQDDAELDYEDVLELASKAYENPPQVATAHVKFRIAELNDGFPVGMTSEECRKLLSESGVTSQPDKLRDLLGSLIKEPNQLEAKPWSSVDLYQGPSGIRTTTSTSTHSSDYWIGREWSYRWDSAKSQASLLRREDDRFHKDETLVEFLQQRRMTFAWLKSLKPISIRNVGDKILLRSDRNSELQQETTLDAVSGRIHSAANSSHGVVIGERLQFGWREFNDDFWLPSVIAEFRYRRGELDHCRFIVIEDASFNQPLPDGTFSFGVPAGSVIVDKRVGLSQTYTINRDVADVTSDEQLEAAWAPVSEDSDDVGKPIQIIGHVRDIDGKPVSGAKVSHPALCNGRLKPNRTQTDAEGRFEFSVVGKNLVNYPALWIWHDGYSLATPSVYQFIPGAVENSKPEVILPPESVVRFRIERPDGRSLKNADVYPTKMRIPNGNEPMDGMHGLFSFLPDDELKEFATRKTDENGEVELRHVPADVLTAVGVATDEFGIQEFDITSLAGPRRLTMEPVGRLIGTAPPGTRIAIQSRRGGAPVIGEGRANIAVGADGHFEVKALVRGQVTITSHNSEHPEWLMEDQSANLEPASTLTIDIMPEGIIPATGRLVHANSDLPIANAWVALQVGTSTRTHLGSVVTDAEGKFT